MVLFQFSVVLISNIVDILLFFHYDVGVEMTKKFEFKTRTHGNKNLKNILIFLKENKFSLS